MQNQFLNFIRSILCESPFPSLSPIAQMMGGYLLSKHHRNRDLEMWFLLAVEAKDVNIHYPGLAGSYFSSIAPMIHLNNYSTSQEKFKQHN